MMRSINPKLFAVPAVVGLALLLARIMTPPQYAATRSHQPAGEVQKRPAKPSQQSFVNRAAWHTECSAAKKKERRCQMERIVPGPNRKGVLMRIVITRAAGEKTALAQVMVPPAVLLPAGVEFKPQGAKPLKLAYTSCSQKSCVAPIVMDDALIEELASGIRLDVRFVMRNQEAVDVAINLNGFAEAYEKLTKESPLGDPHGAGQDK